MEPKCLKCQSNDHTVRLYALDRFADLVLCLNCYWIFIHPAEKYNKKPKKYNPYKQIKGLKNEIKKLKNEILTWEVDFQQMYDMCAATVDNLDLLLDPVTREVLEKLKRMK